MGKKLFLFAAAAVALASCTETDLSGDTSLAKESTSDAIQFSAKAGNSGVTRAYTSGTIGNETQTKRGITDLKEAGFGVFAYFTGNADYVTSPTPTAKEPNFMYNQKLTWSTSNPTNMWVYSPVKYWPNGIDADNVDDPSHTAMEKESGKVSFFAVAPFTDTPSTDYTIPTGEAMPTGVTASDVKQNDLTSGIKAMTTNAFTGNVWVKYLMPKANQSQAVDLLWGLAGKAKYDETDGVDPAFTIGESYNLNLTKQTVKERVSFLFKHALAKVGGATTATETESTEGDPKQCGFKVVADVDKNDGDDQKTYFPTSFNSKETLITIKEVKIQDGKSASDDDAVTKVTGLKSNFNTFGWFNIETGSWCNDPNTYGNNGDGAEYNIKVLSTDTDVDNNESYSLNEKIREVASYTKSTESGLKKLNADGKTWGTGYPTGVTTTPQPLFANENVPGLLVIPGGTESNELYITVDYVVRTADPNLKDGFTNVEQIITNKVSLGALNPNKYYTIIMHLGLTSVKFEAVVADWAAKETEAYNPSTGADESTGNDNESKVWLPSNVVDANTWVITPSANPIAAKGGDITLTTVKINDNTLEYQASSPATAGKYTLTESSGWLSIDGTGKITADAYTTSTADRTAIVYVSTKVNDNTITTPITLTQKGFSLEYTSASDKIVTVKDGDDQKVTTGYTVVVSGGDGAGTANSTDETITVNGTEGQTYKVTVTHSSGATKEVTVTLPVTP